MPILYKVDKHAFHTEGPSLTEQEHAPDTDANIMIKRAAKGLNINTSSIGGYGYDDTTLDAVQLRMQKQQLEDYLAEAQKTQEFTKEEISELERVAPAVAKRFQWKLKQDTPAEQPAPAITPAPEKPAGPL